MSPRIILWDIETLFDVVAVWRLMNYDMIPADNILKERYIVTAAWKELGAEEVHSVSVLDDPERFKVKPDDDLHVLNTLHDVLSSADAIVHHNGRAYDTKFTATRMLIQGLPPLPPIPQLDTYSLAKDKFLFNSNSLDYIGQVTGVGRKRETPKGLWLRALAGDVEAIKEMVLYNEEDVRLLEGVFLKMRPYAPNHFNLHLYGAEGMACPRCGSLHTHEDTKTHVTTSRTYRRFQCDDCGGWFRSVFSNGSAKVRVL